MSEAPGASQFTVFAEGDDKITTMSPRRNVPAPSAFTVFAAELPPAERERLRRLEAPRAAANQELPRFECRNYVKCKFAFVSEAAKVDHEAGCADRLKLGEEQYKKENADKPITRDEIKTLVAETVSATMAEVVKALRGGGTKEKKKRGRPRGSSKTHRSGPEAAGPEPVGEVESAEEAVADPPAEPDPT